MLRGISILVVSALLSLAATDVMAKGSSSRGASKGGSHSVKGYTRKDGTYVAPHQRTNPNKTKSDNWSTKGNTNPYTGKPGTVDPLTDRK